MKQKEKFMILGGILIVLCCLGVLLWQIPCNWNLMLWGFLGGPGASDYAFDVAEGYELGRTSAHSIMITPKRVWTVGKDEIPSEILRLDWDENFVIAERDSSNRLESPRLDYWILDASIQKVYGPLSLKEFTRQRMLIGVPDGLTLRSVESCRNWWDWVRSFCEE